MNLQTPATFVYTNQLGETSKYKAEEPNFDELYKHDITVVQEVIDTNSDPELLEAALEMLDHLQADEEDVENCNAMLHDNLCLLLAIEKTQITPGQEPPVRKKKPKTILKDQIREKLLTSKLRYFRKSEMKYE